MYLDENNILGNIKIYSVSHKTRSTLFFRNFSACCKPRKRKKVFFLSGLPVHAVFENVKNLLILVQFGKVITETVWARQNKK
jgi:hypothetical protein